MSLKITNIAFVLSLAFMACGSNAPDSPDKPDGPDPDNGVDKVISVTSNLDIDLRTDRALYSPGQPVKFTSSSPVDGYRIRYRRGMETVAEADGHGTSWTWTPPTVDYTGYMVDVYRPGDDTEEIHGTIAVDVSSDWKRYPRYGFVATFDRSKLTIGLIEAEMEYLNRCHINGVQFQDWHYKHHWPLGGTPGALLDTYTDIANREVSTDVVRRYIDVQHSYGMKSIFYNLCFGVLDDAKEDGVDETWNLYKDASRGSRDFHQLPASWKSDIYLVDPANAGWQEYIGKRNDDVYASLDFDGYQIDQLGNRGTLYDYNGKTVNLPNGYRSFINAMKARHPAKSLVMNSVSSYGASQIAGSGKVDFCYNELWNDEDMFEDLHKVIKANDAYSNGTLSTVFAAYMNYDYADRHQGYFNNPGVIMADAVMMALGGSHLELGDHMLSREYFPASPLAMDENLRTAMIRYYDFMTAYQNLLRGTGTASETEVSLSCDDASKRVKFQAWPPKARTVTTYARKVDGRTIVHLLNFINTDDLSWRDLNASRVEPLLKKDVPVSMKVDGNVKNVWMASPDIHGGASVQLPFSLSKGVLSFTVPSLKYWDMIVIE